MIHTYTRNCADLPSCTGDGDDSERGDVPGWVLITLMTAGLVVTIWTVAGPALTQVFTTALEKVASF